MLLKSKKLYGISKSILDIDGASRGNPGIQVVEGYLRIMMQMLFLGIKTSYQAKLFRFMRAIEIAKQVKWSWLEA